MNMVPPQGTVLVCKEGDGIQIVMGVQDSSKYTYYATLTAESDDEVVFPMESSSDRYRWAGSVLTYINSCLGAAKKAENYEKLFLEVRAPLFSLSDEKLEIINLPLRNGKTSRVLVNLRNGYLIGVETDTVGWFILGESEIDESIILSLLPDGYTAATNVTMQYSSKIKQKGITLDDFMRPVEEIFSKGKINQDNIQILTFCLMEAARSPSLAGIMAQHFFYQPYSPVSYDLISDFAHAWNQGEGPAPNSFGAQEPILRTLIDMSLSDVNSTFSENINEISDAKINPLVVKFVNWASGYVDALRGKYPDCSKEIDKLDKLAKKLERLLSYTSQEDGEEIEEQVKQAMKCFAEQYNLVKQQCKKSAKYLEDDIKICPKKDDDEDDDDNFGGSSGKRTKGTCNKIIIGEAKVKRSVSSGGKNPQGGKKTTVNNAYDFSTISVFKQGTSTDPLMYQKKRIPTSHKDDGEGYRIPSQQNVDYDDKYGVKKLQQQLNFFWAWSSIEDASTLSVFGKGTSFDTVVHQKDQAQISMPHSIYNQAPYISDVRYQVPSLPMVYQQYSIPPAYIIPNRAPIIFGYKR